MSSLFDGLTRRLGGGELLAQLSRTVGADEAGTGTAMSTILPVLLGALARNTSTSEGATALDQALARNHDGSIMDNLGQHLSAPNLPDGRRILGHVLGNKRAAVEQQVSGVSGLSPEKVGLLMATLAPVLLGVLGQARQQRGLNPASMAGLIRSEQQAVMARSPGLGRLAQLLDRNNDGSITDDLARLRKGLLGN